MAFVVGRVRRPTEEMMDLEFGGLQRPSGSTFPGCDRTRTRSVFIVCDIQNFGRFITLESRQ